MTRQKKVLIYISFIVVLIYGCSNGNNGQFSSRVIPDVEIPSTILEDPKINDEVLSFCWRPSERISAAVDVDRSSYILLMKADRSNLVMLPDPEDDTNDINKLGCISFDQYSEQDFRTVKAALSWQPGTNRLYFSSGVNPASSWLYFVELDEILFDVSPIFPDDSYKEYFFGINTISWNSTGTSFFALSDYDISPIGVGNNIWVINQPSGSVKRITDYEKLGDFVPSAAWSPNSTKLVLGLGEETSGVEIINLADGTSTRVTNQEYPELVGWPHRVDSLFDVILEGYSSNPIGVFANYLMSSEPVWLHSGREILFAAPTADGRIVLFVVSSSGENFRELLPGLPGIIGFPALSPGGNELAFIRYPSWSNTKKVEIMIYNFDSETLSSLIVLPVPENGSRLYISGLSWSPNGNHLSFSSNHEGQSNIYLISLDGKAWINLTKDIDGDAVHPIWKP